jgi:uncharacterized membrane protein
MLLYFSHGVGEFYSAQGFHLYASLEIFFSFMTFSASITFIKYNAKIEKKFTK